MKTTPLRKAARGRECQLRLPGYCTHDPETTSLCHVRIAGTCGVSIKPPDVCAYIGCNVCHDIQEGRRKSEISAEDLTEYVLDAVLRTQALFWNEGLLKVGR